MLIRNRKYRGPDAQQSGFSLVELLTVVAIIGVAAGLGIVYLDSGRKGKSAEGFAETLGAQYEMARARAVATQKRQRIVIEPQRFTHWQSKITGLALSSNPTNYTSDWDFVFEGQPHPDVTMWAVRANTLEHEPVTVQPSEDTSLLVAIDILPDGRARTYGSASFFEAGWTIFITDTKTEVRTLLFAVTGTSITYNGW